MANDRPDPGDFFTMAQRVVRELFGDARGGEDPWADVTRRFRESVTGDHPSASAPRHREPSADEQRENLTFALATRAVEALEDLALNVAAIRQRLERTDAPPARPRPRPARRDPDGGDAAGK